MREGVQGWKTKRAVSISATCSSCFLLISLVAVLVVFTILDSRFMTIDNIINISRQMSINMIIAVGMTFCMISGGFDLSVGSVGAMAGCLTGITMAATENVLLGVSLGIASGHSHRIPQRVGHRQAECEPVCDDVGIDDRDPRHRHAHDRRLDHQRPASFLQLYRNRVCLGHSLAGHLYDHRRDHRAHPAVEDRVRAEHLCDRGEFQGGPLGRLEE